MANQDILSKQRKVDPKEVQRLEHEKFQVERDRKRIEQIEREKAASKTPPSAEKKK